MQEIRQLTQELVQEDLAQERREELERMRESTLRAEGAKEQEVMSDLAELEKLARTPFPREEAVVFAQAIEAADEAGKRQRAGEVLEYSVLNNAIGTPGRHVIDEAIDNHLRTAGLLAQCGLLTDRLRANEPSEDSDKTSFAPRVLDNTDLSLLKSRLRSDTPLPMQLLESAHHIVRLLRHSQSEADAELIDQLVMARELDTLFDKREVIDQFKDSQVLVDMLAKYGRRELAVPHPSSDALKLVDVLKSLGDMAASLTEELHERWANRVLYIEDNGELDELTRDGLEKSLRGLTAAFYLAKLYRTLDDEPRSLYYGLLFTAYQPWRDVWEKVDLTPPWTKAEEQDLTLWIGHLKEKVRKHPKVFEKLSVAEISGTDAKEITERLRALPTVLAEEIARRQLVVNVTLDGVEGRLRRELGQAFELVDKAALQAFVTAEVAQLLPEGCDFSCASNLYWKGLEIQLRERIFRPLRNTRPIPNTPAGDDRSLQGTLASYLSGDQRAEKAMTLMPMLILMKKALSDEDCRGNDALRHLRKFVHKQHSHLITQPECVDFGRLERQHEDLRNPGVHTRPMTRPDSETSRMAVFEFICALWSASPH
jgi:hypothetical protein